jgi:4,4'-diaponeurosporenoate glycosyltransferase
MTSPLGFTALALGLMSLLIARVPRLAPRRAPAGVDRRRHGEPGDAPAVSVVIPARDEAGAIGALLADLRGQEPRPFEVIVVDDGSTDATAAIATAGGATVVAAGPTPAGWAPKVWALHTGARRGSGEVLVFLDADVRLGPGALGALLDGVAQHGGVLSVAPHHHANGVIEATSAAANAIVVAGGGPGLRRRDRCAAVGSCIALARSDYERMGGFAANPATIVEDLDLARTARRHHLAVRLRRGGGLVTMRSYPDGLRAVIDGWSKNLAAGARRTPPESGLIVAAWVTTLVMPLALVARGRVAEALGCWSLTAAHSAWLLRRVGRFDLAATSAGAPLLGLFTTFLAVRSLALRASGRPVTWRSRRLSPNGLSAPPPARRSAMPGARR